MPDIIRLLPDSIANQIAAGEVIQRPASVVKELLENSIDSGANTIKLIIKDSGKTLIQVIDNGCGMSPTDARMCFERHATSKIREANDLFAIRTFGFRGEALASIAAISHVELKTRKHGEDIGTCLELEGAKVKSQDPIGCPIGTSMAVRNLFFNVPARRNFLKSDSVEFRHILEEFQRVALIHPDIEFSLHHNDKLTIQLPKENLKQRIGHIFASSITEKLLPVEMNTDHVVIHGYIGKPETARKTRGEQYFFANGRFIKHAYLNHAVEQAFKELIPHASFPSYFLHVEVDPTLIDVNIHPTKTEVNFQHGQLIYASLRAAVKHSLGMFSLSPTIDFETENAFNTEPPKGYEPKLPEIKINPDYNPFQTQKKSSPKQRNSDIKPNRDNWEKLYEVVETPRQKQNVFPETQEKIVEIFDKEPVLKQDNNGKFFQILNRFIVVAVKSGMLLVDQQKAHERILFDRSLSMLSNESGAQQACLFPLKIQVSAQDANILKEIHNDLAKVGFDLADLGKGTFSINATPVSLPVDEAESFLEQLIEGYKNGRLIANQDRNTFMALNIARSLSIKPGKKLTEIEMQNIIDELFACKTPEIALDGKKIFKNLSENDLVNLLGS